jgi:hypothetical protein
MCVSEAYSSKCHYKTKQASQLGGIQRQPVSQFRSRHAQHEAVFKTSASQPDAAVRDSYTALEILTLKIKHFTDGEVTKQCSELRQMLLFMIKNHNIYKSTIKCQDLPLEVEPRNSRTILRKGYELKQLIFNFFM